MRYYDTYDYMYSTTTPIEEAIGWIAAIYFIILLVITIFALASYVFKGIGMYTIARRQGRENAWIAFVPFARTYLHGELGGSIKLKNKTIQSPGIWLLALPFIYGAVASIFYGILWVIGFGVMLTASNDFGYGRSVGAGTIMGIIVLALIVVIISVLYQAIYKVLGILVNHQIYAGFTSKNMSIAHAVLSAVVPLYESICLFVMRNRPYNPGMEPEIRNPYTQVRPDYSWRPVENPAAQSGPEVPPQYPSGPMRPTENPAAQGGPEVPPQYPSGPMRPTENPAAQSGPEVPPQYPSEPASPAGSETAQEEAPRPSEPVSPAGSETVQETEPQPAADPSVIYVEPSPEESEKEE